MGLGIGVGIGVGGASGAGGLARPRYDAATKTASGKAPPNATVTVAVNGTTSGTATANAQGAWSYVFGTAPTAGQVITATANVTSSGYPVPGSAAPRIAGNAKVYVLADSRGLDNFRPNAATTPNDTNPELTNGSRAGIGPVNYARGRLAGAFEFRKENCNGHGGATVAEIFANQWAAALASDCKILFFLAGVNSTNSQVDPVATAALIKSKGQEWCARGSDYVFISWDEVPNNTTYPAAHAQLRDLLRTHEDKPNGIYVRRSWNLVATAPDATTYNAAFYRDNIHWNTYGASRMGYEVDAAAIAAVLPASPVKAFERPGAIGSVYGLDANCEFIGTSVPAGWSLPTATGVAYSMEQVDGHNWLVVTLTDAPTLNLTILPSTFAIPSGFTVGTSTVDLTILHKRAGCSNVSAITANAQKQSGTVLLDKQNVSGRTAGDFVTSGSATWATYGTPVDTVGTETLWMDNCLLAADATQLRPRIVITGISGQNSNGVLKFAMPQMRAL